jgi:periplasmic copper chaperone A
MRMFVVACCLALVLLTTSATAQQGDGAGLEVQHPWARASTGTTGAAYFSVLNRGTARDRLVTVRTPVAEKAELHESKMENGIMTMRPVGPLTIEPGQSAVLKPGANHVMLMGLKHPLKEGDSFPITLSFEKGGDVEVTVAVARAGAMGSDAMDHGSMQHMPQGGMDHENMK